MSMRPREMRSSAPAMRCSRLRRAPWPSAVAAATRRPGSPPRARKNTPATFSISLSLTAAFGKCPPAARVIRRCQSRPTVSSMVLVILERAEAGFVVARGLVGDPGEERAAGVVRLGLGAGVDALPALGAGEHVALDVARAQPHRARRITRGLAVGQAGGAVGGAVALEAHDHG